MSEEGKQAALAIAEQILAKEIRIAQLEDALNWLVEEYDDDPCDEEPSCYVHARRVLAKAGPR